ncbi:MAG: sugar transferase, partial [Lachnospiraceae bacterium]|nr:sugar transferase [Lachnospiraceae bacterium]
AYILAYYVRQKSFVLLQSNLYRGMFFAFFFIQFSVSIFGESFKNVLKRGFYREFAQTVKHTAQIILIATFYLFAIKEGQEYSRIIMLVTGALYLGFSYVSRILWKYYLKKHGFSDTRNCSLLVLTTEGLAESVISNLKENNMERYQIAGVAFYDQEPVKESVGGIAVVAGKETFFEYICREWVDEVLVVLPNGHAFPEETINTLIEMGVTTHVKLFEAADLQGQKQVVERIGTYTVLTSSINMASTRQVIYKRTLDILGGLVGCIMTVVFTIVVGPIIYLKSPGPIFFSQIRVGKNGRKFKIYKFRSMYMDAEERKKELMAQNRVKDGMMFKMENDPRIIGGSNGIGGIIRKYSIDEFPQFWNVLKGDMSLVGTRPPTVDEWEKYDLHHRVRLAIKPGITGMWQVSGRSEITDFEEVVRLDKEYISNWTMGLDFKLLFKTVAVVLGKDGSM